MGVLATGTLSLSAEASEGRGRPWEQDVDAQGNDLYNLGVLEAEALAGGLAAQETLTDLAGEDLVIRDGALNVGVEDSSKQSIVDDEPIAPRNLSVADWSLVDMVAAGADPTGEEDVVPILEEEANDDTLLVFPPGTYLMGESFVQHGLSNFGIKGIGQPAFTINEDFEGGASRLFHHGGGGGSADMGNFYMGGFDIDYTDPGVGYPVFNIGATRLVMEDITVRGPDDSGNQTIMFIPAVRDPEGYGLIRNVNIPDGKDHGDPDAFQGGSTCYVGAGHSGHLRVEDCVMRYGGDNGFRISANSTGNVVIDGGLYGNSDRCGIRIQGHGNHTVKNCEIVVDDHRTGFSILRGIWIQQPDGVTGGHVIENVRIRMTDVPGGEDTFGSQYPIFVASGTGNVIFRNIILDDDRPGETEFKGQSIIVGGEDDSQVTMENIYVEGGPDHHIFDIRSANNVFENISIKNLNPDTGTTFLIQEGADGTRLDGTRIDPDRGEIRIEAEDCVLRDVNGDIPIDRSAATRARINDWSVNEGNPSVDGEWAGNGFEGAQVRDESTGESHVYLGGEWRSL